MKRVYFTFFLALFFSVKVFSQEKLSNNIMQLERAIDLKETLPIQKAQPQNISTGDQKNQTKRYNILYDFNSMNNEVKQKISYNKYNNLTLSEGILKSYSIRVYSITNKSDFESILLLLKKMKGYVNAELVKDQLVILYIQPEYSSIEIKEFFEKENIRVDFLDEKYLIDKLKQE
jgi:hypothetical protein